MAISKSEARRLAQESMELGARVLRGELVIGPNEAEINGKKLTEWLKEYEGQEMILVAAPVGAIAIESQIKSCYTCGRDYTGTTCPRCAEARARLRG